MDAENRPRAAAPRILFVDDEPHALSAIRRLVGRHRRRWTLTFVTSGAEALAHLEREPVDVLVTDMRMPGMDGTAVLSRTRDCHPRVARVVLSGHADDEEQVQRTGLSATYLSKPCDSELLVRTISGLVADRRAREAG